jgi:hypothetical protein
VTKTMRDIMSAAPAENRDPRTTGAWSAPS